MGKQVVSGRLAVTALDGIPEIREGDDLVALLSPGLADIAWRDGTAALVDGDVVVVTSKVVSKAEGRLVYADNREQAITDETVRVVASVTRNGITTRIVENRLGLVMAAAGVDASNTADGTLLLLPEDPDGSARTLRAGLEARFGVRLAVVVTDTVGRPWRNGLVDIAIGAAGLRVLDDLRGLADTHGREMRSTVAGVADEIASAVELVTPKTSGRPAAVMRGVGHLVIGPDGPGARTLNRPAAEDLFRVGAAEAYAEGWRAACAAIAAGRLNATDVAEPTDASGG